MTYSVDVAPNGTLSGDEVGLSVHGNKGQVSSERAQRTRSQTRRAYLRWRRRIAWETLRPSLLIALGVTLLLVLLDRAVALVAPPTSTFLIPLETTRDDLHRLALFAISILATFLIAHYALRLRSSERLHRHMIEKTNDFSGIIDKDGICVYMTESIAQVAGYSPAELIGKSFLDQLPPENRESALALFQHVLESDPRTLHRTENTIRHKDGREIALELSITNCLDVPEIRGVVIYNRDITHLRLVEQEHRHSLQRLQQLFHSMSNPSIILQILTDENGNEKDLLVLEANEAAREMVHPRPLEQRHLTEVLPEMDFSWISKLAAVVKGSEPLRFFDYSPLFNRHLDISAFRLTHEQLAVTIQDVTEQMANLDWVSRQRDLMLALSQAEGLEQAQKIALEAACELSGMELGGLYLRDTSGALKLAVAQGISPEMEQAVSYFAADDPRTQSILAGTPYITDFADVENLTTPEKQEGIQTLMVTPIHHRSQVIGTLNLGTRHLGAIGKRSRQAAETVASQIGGVIAIQQAAQNLKASEQLLSTTLKSLSEAVIITDTKGRLTFINPTAEKLCGVSETAAIGRPAQDIYAIRDERTHQAAEYAFMDVLGGHCLHNETELLLCSRTGREYTIAHAASAIRNENEELLGVVVVFRDLTDLRRLEDHLRQQQKLEAIGTLASGVAHEINNPTNVVMSNAELLADFAHDPESVHQCAREILRESHRIASIVRSLLSFARREQRTAGTPVSVRELVDETLSLTRKALQRNQVEVRVDLQDDLPLALWRGQQIQQVLMNLVMNANDALAEYAEGERQLVIAAKSTHDDRKQGIVLEVANNGPAIDTSIQRRIFDPFFTTKERDKGTGLGLSVSYGIIREHGGHVDVESAPGAWTRFRVELPLTVGPAPSPD